MGEPRSLWTMVGTWVSVLMLGLATVAVAGGTTKGQGASHAESSTIQFMDLQWLKPGVSPQQAGAYFADRLGPIVRKHGGKIVFTYQVVGTMKGDVKPAVVASMEFASMDSMQEMFKDPEYQKIVPQRDATFDLSRMSLFQIAPFGVN